MFGVPAASAADGSSIGRHAEHDVRDRTTVVASGTIGQAAQLSLLTIAGMARAIRRTYRRTAIARRRPCPPTHGPVSRTASRSRRSGRSPHSTASTQPIVTGPRHALWGCSLWPTTAVRSRASRRFRSRTHRSTTRRSRRPSGGTITTFRSSQHRPRPIPSAVRSRPKSTAARLSLHEQAISGSAPAGYAYLGQDVVASGPAAAPSNRAG